MDDKNKKNNVNDFINGVIKETMQNAEFKQAMATIPQMVSTFKAIYDEMKKQGFDDAKAYDFAKSVMTSGGK